MPSRSPDLSHASHIRNYINMKVSLWLIKQDVICSTGSGGIAPYILNPASLRGQCLMPRLGAFTSGGEPQVGSQLRSERVDDESDICPC
jgi:hypothetical protein